VTPNGRRAVSASDDRTLRVWDLETGQPIASFAGDSQASCVATGPDGRAVVAGEASGGVHFLRLENA